MLCTTVVHNDMHTREQFLNLHASLGLNFVSVFFRFSTFRVFRVRLYHFIPALLVFVVSGFSIKTRDWLGRTSLK